MISQCIIDNTDNIFFFFKVFFIERFKSVYKLFYLQTYSTKSRIKCIKTKIIICNKKIKNIRKRTEHLDT